MTVHIVVGKFPDVLQNRFEVFPVGFLLGASLVEGGIIGVLTVTDVGGADDKVELVGFGEDSILTHAFRLQTQLHAEEQLDPVPVFLLQTCQFIEVWIGLKQENTSRSVFRVRKVIVHVFRETHGVQSQFDSPQDHLFHGSLAVSGVVGV